MKFQIFVSVVICVKNNIFDIKKVLKDSTKYLSELVTDYELVVVDNASLDNSVEVFKGLTSSKGLPNLQVYLLTKEVDSDTAALVGLENALGDFVFIFNPAEDNLSVLPEMLEKAVAGNDVVFATNHLKPKQTMGYRIANGFFNFMYRRFNGINLSKDAPECRVLSKRVINFILQHNQPSISYRHLPVTAGFVKSHIKYKSQPKKLQTKKLSQSIEKGIRLMISTTRLPMRIVTFLSLFGASANLLYSIYVMFIWFFTENIAPGWVSSSLQISGMFFLISLVLLVLGEYILYMASLYNEGPQYHVGQEFTSEKMSRLEKLNLENIKPTEKQGA
jgi:polyisoprenyl-phosphate glycosyltransferase